MLQSAFDTYTVALNYISEGYSIIPIRPGTKHPYAKLLPQEWSEKEQKMVHVWHPYQKRQPNQPELRRWFIDNDAGIGIVCGPISGGLLVFDFESVEAYEGWHKIASQWLFTSQLNQMPVVATGRGRHVYFRTDNPPGNQRLATIGETIIAETRGAGGYVLAPPTQHPDGPIYTLLHGEFATVPRLTPEDAQLALDTVRLLMTRPAPTAAAQPSVIDAYNARYTIEQVLVDHGYVKAGEGRYIRPGGQHSSVAIHAGRSSHYNTNDPLYSEAPGGGVYSHSPFSAYAHLNHKGDMKEATRAAALDLGIALQPAASTPGQLDTDRLLEQAARAVGLASATPDDASTWPYFERDGGMWMHRHEKDGSPKLPMVLANFTAQITAETTVHDGETTSELYRITARCGQRTKTLEMPRADFEGESALGRIVAALGAKARVNPAAQARYVLDAIKAFSCQIQEHTMHTHTGWVDGRYLVGNGYIDSDGWHSSTSEHSSRAHLPQRLERYRLAPDGDLASAAALLGDLIDLAPPTVMIPLLGGVLLGPISQFMDAAAPMIHVYGPTGSHKTSICCAAMAFWGDFLPAHPTDTWTSTANSVQRLGWHLKDAPMVLDDFKSANVKSNQVTFLLQNYGDGMARGRLDSNSEARSAYPIRAVLISSGEDQPEGEASTLARILSVPLARGAVHRGRLTALQGAWRGLQPLSIAFVQWLATHAAEMPSYCQKRHHTTRATVLAVIESTEHATNPGRVASNVASLATSWACFTRFMVEAGQWTEKHARVWMETVNATLTNLARQQLELTTGERYSALFLDAIRAIMASGRGFIANNETENEMLSTQVLLGARDRNGLYLIPDVAYDEVCKQARMAGRQVGYSKKALGQMLHQDGLLQSVSPGTMVVQKRINGTRLWCWHFASDLLDS